MTNYSRLIATPLEYLIRLDDGVRKSSTWSRGTEYKAIRDKIIELCEGCKTRIFEQIAIFKKVCDGEQPSAAEDQILRSVLRSTSGRFIALHELLLFLPRESIRRELLDYCDCLFRNEFDQTKISLILTSLFNAFEYSLDDVMRFLESDVFKFKTPDPKSMPFGNVMELAIIDRNNPLAWAILAHEFGHFLDQQRGITKRAVQQYSAKLAKQPVPDAYIKRWERICSEIVADLTGYYLQGPCSILPLVNMSLLVGCAQEPPIKFDGEHGAPTTRIEMIRLLCSDDKLDIASLNPQLETLIDEQASKQLQLPADERDQRLRFHKGLLEFFNEVRPLIINELRQRQFPHFEPQSHGRAERLCVSLAKGLPIGALRVHPEAEARERLLTDDIIDPARARDSYYLLEERAVGANEVIAAGWLNRIETTTTILRRAFAQPKQEDVFAELISRLQQEDNLILKSIDMIPMLEAQHAPT